MESLHKVLCVLVGVLTFCVALFMFSQAHITHSLSNVKEKHRELLLEKEKLEIRINKLEEKAGSIELQLTNRTILNEPK